MAQIEQPDYYPLLVGKPMIAAINGACAGIGVLTSIANGPGAGVPRGEHHDREDL